MNVNFISPNLYNNLHLLTDIADVYGLQQLINEPSHVTSSSSTMTDNCSTRVVCPVFPISALVIIV